MRIKPLSAQLASYIAAGEVIERPASVLKELLENSLDAGSSKLEINIENGGVKLIQVRDDGCGIHKADLILALQQHATSKITALSDLACITSLGFRGEALASIAAVAELQLISKPADQEHAWQISNTLEPTVIPAAHPNGTTIKVKNLFHNIPARRKFLRSERTEYVHLEEVFKRVALSHLDIGFIWTNNGKQLYNLPACTSTPAQEQRLAKICGKRMLTNTVYIDVEQNGLRLSGWLGLPADARATAEAQYFYVNRRMVRDRVINHALKQGYQAQLAPGKHANYCLYLEVDPATIDVNVHPTKHEVRFQDARVVHAFLQSTVQQCLMADPHNQLTTELQAPVAAAYTQSMSCDAAMVFSPVPQVSTVSATTIANSYMATVQTNSAAEPLVKILAILNKNKFALIEYVVPNNTAACKYELLDILAAKLHLYAAQQLSVADNQADESFNLSKPATVHLAIEITTAALTLFSKLGFVAEQIGAKQLLIKAIPAIFMGCIFNYAELFFELSRVQQKFTQQEDYQINFAVLLKLIARHTALRDPVAISDALSLLTVLKASLASFAANIASLNTPVTVSLIQFTIEDLHNFLGKTAQQAAAISLV